MAGTVSGGRKAYRTNIEQQGEDWYQRIGALGGSKGRTGGFYGNRDLASKWGSIGGTISRRTGATVRTPRPTKTQIREMRRRLYEEQSAMSKQSILAKYGKQRSW